MGSSKGSRDRLLREREALTERVSIKALERILGLAQRASLDVVVIGGYAVRAYTTVLKRFTKDIDLAVPDVGSLEKLRGILETLGFQTRRTFFGGVTGYMKEKGISIVVNAIVSNVEGSVMRIEPYYPGNPSIEARVACLEDVLISKLQLLKLPEEERREKDLIDVVLLLLSSCDLISAERLQERLREREVPVSEVLSALGKVKGSLGLGTSGKPGRRMLK